MEGGLRVELPGRGQGLRSCSMISSRGGSSGQSCLGWGKSGRSPFPHSDPQRRRREEEGWYRGLYSMAVRVSRTLGTQPSPYAHTCCRALTSSCRRRSCSEARTSRVPSAAPPPAPILAAPSRCRLAAASITSCVPARRRARRAAFRRSAHAAASASACSATACKPITPLVPSHHWYHSPQ